MNRKKLPEKWKVLKFKDCIVQLSTGLNPRKNFSLGHGSIRYITAKNLIGRGEIDFSTADYIDAEAKKIINKRSKIKAGDILFSSRAPIGQTYLISTEPSYFDIGESIFSIRANKEVITPEYLCLYLSSDYFIKSASKHVTGSVIQEIRIGNLMETEIVVPPIEMQIKIAECINSIDYKIQLNNHINKKIESMAKTIYDYWFLQFEFPNKDGKPYKASGGKMVWNEELKREIPDGWKISKIGDICEITRGVSYTAANLKSDGTPILSLASISRKGQYIPEGIKYYSGKYNESKVLKPYDAIMCNTDMTQEKEIVAKVILVPDIFGKSQILSTHHISHLVFDDEIYKEYVYLTTQTKWFHNHIKGFSAGTNVLGLDSDGFKDFKLLIPTNDVLIKFNKIVMDNEMYKSNLINENQELASLRDFLLPMLMNGQVTFKEANE